MSDSLIYITERFKGSFVTEPLEIQQRFSKIKAYVFDWDGVFNNGQKDESGSSPFNEVDAMGTNLLRFNHYLRTGDTPFFAVISGERNKAALTLAKREHFHAVYCSIKYKAEALQHLCAAYEITPEEVAFVFDDVLDFSVAAVCGLRIMVSRQCNPLLIDFAVQHQLVDYLTSADGNSSAVRETVELLTGLSGRYGETVEHRMNFTETYQQYLLRRNMPEVLFYTSKESKIIEDQAS
jgi:3-deoxy-D-manno-octulosonate 8-phosphate phosphatase (KDO 8-P phosphatase)